jgi:hypothetical protein
MSDRTSGAEENLAATGAHSRRGGGLAVERCLAELSNRLDGFVAP